MAQYAKYEKQHVRPWKADEFIQVGEVECVYELAKDAPESSAVVVLPGGRRATMRELALEGFRVVPPERWRRTPGS